MRLLAVVIALGVVTVVESRKDPYDQDSGKYVHLSSKSGKSSKGSSHLTKSSKRSGSKSGKGGSKSGKNSNVHSGYGYDRPSAAQTTFVPTFSPTFSPTSSPTLIEAIENPCTSRREARCCNNQPSNSDMLNRKCEKWLCFC